MTDAIRGTVRRYLTPAGNPAFEYSIELGRSPDGKRLQSRKRGFAGEAEARAAMETELVDRRRGQHIDPSRTPLADYLAEWLETTAPSRRANTNRSLRDSLARCAPLGDVPLARLQSQQVQRWVNDLAARLAPQTVALTHAALAAALNQAVAWGHLARNPATGVALPKPPSRRERSGTAWSADEAVRFLAATAGDPWAPLWRLLLDGQLRIGEALALRWTDLDLDAGIVRVRRTLTRDDRGRWLVGDRPKTDDSVRDVAVGAATSAALRRQRAAVAERRLRAGPAWRDDGLVFPRADGRAHNPATSSANLDRAIAVAGVPRITPHGLRRTGATLLAYAGVDPRTVADRLGHRSIAMTLDVYTVGGDRRQRQAADVLAGILDGAQSA